MNEEQLLDKIKKDPQHFAILYDRYFSKIFNYIFKRTGDFDVSKDICAEVFLKAFLSISTFSWRGVPLQSWLYRIATNETNLYFRQKKYAQRLKDTIGQAAFQNANVFDLQREREEAERKVKEYDDFLIAQTALKKLPLIYQEVLSLRYFEKKKIQEIALILNKKQGTVKSLLSRGLVRLRELMNVQPKE